MYCNRGIKRGKNTQIIQNINDVSAKTVYALLKSADNATVYIDCVQVEKMPTASRYNLVENSDFSLSTGWTSTGTETGDGITTVTAAAPPLDGSALTREDVRGMSAEEINRNWSQVRSALNQHE